MEMGADLSREARRAVRRFEQSMVSLGSRAILDMWRLVVLWDGNSLLVEESRRRSAESEKLEARRLVELKLQVRLGRRVRLRGEVLGDLEYRVGEPDLWRHRVA